MKLRRFEIHDRWEYLNGRIASRIVSRHFTEWGARLSVRIVSPVLRGRGRQASLVLVDTAAGREEVLDNR